VFGKTHIALAISHHINRSYILTSTLQLQDQYQDTNDRVVSLKGRGNYSCGIDPRFSVDAAPCMAYPDLLKDCKGKKICPYYNQKNKALASHMMITNYLFFLYSTHCGFAAEGDGENPWTKREAVIMDEAHNLESHLISFAEINLSIEDLYKKYDLPVKNVAFTKDQGLNDIILQDIFHMLEASCESVDAELQEEFRLQGNLSGVNWAKAFSGTVADKIKRLNAKKYKLDKILQPMKMFYASSSNDWIIHPNVEENSITLTPLKADFIFHRHIEPMANKFVFMSATLGDKKSFCDELGLPVDEVLFIETGTSFPAELSPIIALPRLKMGYKDIDETIPQAIELIEKILLQHPDEKGIIHCGTYKLQTEILNRIDPQLRKRLVARDMTDNVKLKNEQLLEIHSSLAEPTILLSPSLMEGTDLFDELSRFQIILKLHWPALGDIRVKKKSELSGDWYANSMWNKILQASGRSTRHEKDYSVTYICDQSFTWWKMKWGKKFPKWFTDRIIEM
jgi:Rad3-related DNA helicase